VRPVVGWEVVVGVEEQHLERDDFFLFFSLGPSALEQVLDVAELIARLLLDVEHLDSLSSTTSMARSSRRLLCGSGFSLPSTLGGSTSMI